MRSLGIHVISSSKHQPIDLSVSSPSPTNFIIILPPSRWTTPSSNGSTLDKHFDAWSTTQSTPNLDWMNAHTTIELTSYHPLGFDCSDLRSSTFSNTKQWPMVFRFRKTTNDSIFPPINDIFLFNNEQRFCFRQTSFFFFTTTIKIYTFFIFCLLFLYSCFPIIFIIS